MKTVILDDNGNYERDCNIDEVGVITVSGPNVFSGYKVPAQNKGIWIDTGDGQRWFNTGDLGRQDKDGYFWLTGRKKELIIRGGHNIDPTSIEEPLHQHPEVQLAAAVGRPDEHAGELPVVYVQLKEFSTVTSEELLEFAKSKILERAAWPKQIHIVDQLPLTAIGKIYKLELRHKEIADALTQALANSNVNVLNLSVAEDKTLGTVINVSLAKNDVDEATRLLGLFPFHTRFNT